MPKPYPVRSETHELEYQSERFFRACLPKGWTCEKPEHDYGVDLRVDIYEDHNATGLELVVQLKASKAAAEGAMETVRLRTTTYNHLRNRLQVAMLVKFVSDDKDAYWLLVRDIPPPMQNNRTFSVCIPKSNKLSAIEWDRIQQHVREVTDAKLAAVRRDEIRRNNAE